MGDSIVLVELSSELSDLLSSSLELTFNVVSLSPGFDLLIEVLVLSELLNLVSKCLILDVSSLDLGVINVDGGENRCIIDLSHV